MNKTPLSVVIPAKNEEDNIARCLKSVFENVPDGCDTRVIVVDCCSTDKTVAIAKEFPVKIIGLRPEWFHSASAARFSGSNIASGDFIFFMDADMELKKGFIAEALALMKNDSRIAAVGGKGEEVYTNAGGRDPASPDIYRVARRPKRVDCLGGAGLYRKRCLEKSGSFNPYLFAGGEERELAQRLRRDGFLIFSLPLPMIRHYTLRVEDWGEFMRKKRSNMFLSIGKSMRLCKSPVFLLEALAYYKEFSFFLITAAYLIITAFYAYSGHLRNIALLYAVPFFGIYAVLAVKKRSLKKPLTSIIKWAMLSLDILRGILQKPIDPSLYPRDTLIIKDYGDQE